MGPSITEIITLAKGAGAILRDGYGKHQNIHYKGRIDIVTDMDRRSEAFLLAAIRDRYPEHTIVSEESGHIAGTGQSCWYIDPLDGTTNYAHAFPIFSVSIAYAEDGQVRAGAVYDPMRDECFYAALGKGAWLNGSAIHVSDTPDLLSSLLVTGFPYDSGPDGMANIDHYTHFNRLSQGVRRLGSAALDQCYVAAGRLDGFWELTLRPWDLAAGSLICREAGGVATSLHGDQDLFQEPGSLLVANPAVHALMLREFEALRF